MVTKTPIDLQRTSLSRRSGAVEVDDATLVKRCIDGDSSAFQCLVQRYQKKLFATAFGMIHNAEDALDIVQEAFLKVYRYLPKFQGNSSFYTWTYRIVVNLCIDFLRKEGRQPTKDYDDAIKQTQESQLPEATLFSSGNDYDPRKAFKDRELGEQILHAIDTLSGAHRSVIILREIEGMSYEEISQTLKCSKGTVMSRLHHARSRLRQALSDYVQKGESIAGETSKEGQTHEKQKAS